MRPLKGPYLCNHPDFTKYEGVLNEQNLPDGFGKMMIYLPESEEEVNEEISNHSYKHYCYKMIITIESIKGNSF